MWEFHFPTFPPTRIIDFFIITIMMGMKPYCVILICIFLITMSGTFHALCKSSLEKGLCWALAHFLIRCLSFYHWIIRALYKLWILDLHQIHDLQILCPILWQSLNRMEEKYCSGVSFISDVTDVTCAHAGSWGEVSICFLDCSGVFYLFLNHNRYCLFKSLPCFFWDKGFFFHPPMILILLMNY